MFLMRRAKIEDVPTLLKLAKMVYFINLPADNDIIADKAIWSRQCFQKTARNAGLKPHGHSRKGDGDSLRSADRGAGPLHVGQESGLAAAVSRSDLFMFVLEDTESKGVLGTSQIIAQMGGPGRPNVALRLSKKEMFSRSLQIGATHMVARLHLDETGPTEIGGLILQPSYRGHKGKLGRFLSLVRFHFIGLYRASFSDRVIAEMMAPITPDGRNTLWEYLGRRFINLSYNEADGFCQYSKEFITALFPRDDIYLSLLPPEARAVVGQVGPETVPARRMLEKLGFAYKDLIDCFDGGPTLEARTDDIAVVRDTRRIPLAGEAKPEACSGMAIVSVLDAEGAFRALQSPFALNGHAQLLLPPEAIGLLEANAGALVGCTILEPGRPQAESARRAGKAGTSPKPARRSKAQSSVK